MPEAATEYDALLVIRKLSSCSLWQLSIMAGAARPGQALERLSQLSKLVREFRLHLCQKSASSQGARGFVEKHYVSIKVNNPNLPFLVRECSGIQPRLIARFDHGVEKSIVLSDYTDEQVLLAVHSLAQQAEQ